MKDEHLLKQLKTTISYFLFFDYLPSFNEIHTFFPQKITKKNLQKQIDQFVFQNKLIKIEINTQKKIILNKRKNNSLSPDKQIDELDCPDKPISNHQLLIITPLYTLPQYSISEPENLQFKILNCKLFESKYINRAIRKQKTTKEKICSIDRLIELLSLLPITQMIGITVSASM